MLTLGLILMLGRLRNFLSSLPFSRGSLTIIGLFVVLAAIPLTVFLTQQQQEIRKRAAETMNTGQCRDLSPNQTIPPGNLTDPPYFWKADCNRACTANNQCPQNNFDPQNVQPLTSNWCYGFEGPTGTSADWRCLMLVTRTCQRLGDPGCTGPTATPTPSVTPGASPTPTPTRAPGPTATPTLTPTPLPGSATLEFEFKLQGIGPASPPRNLIRQVKLEIFDTNNERVGPVRSAQAEFGSGVFRGTLNLGDFTSGNYYIKLKLGNTLRKLMQGITTIAPGQIKLPQQELILGDVIENNELDALDYANLDGCLQLGGIPTPTPKPSCDLKVFDLNDDGSITIQDLGILIVNFSHRKGD